MPKTFEGSLSAKGLKFAVIVGRFNDFISERLLEGALDTLLRSGASSDDIEIVKVPGTFEMPVAAKTLAKRGGSDAIICIGCVIRGDTPHSDYVAGMAARGVSKVTLDYECPVAFGVITADSLEQAIERAGAKSGNKGRDAALTAIEIANLLKAIGRKSRVFRYERQAQGKGKGSRCSMRPTSARCMAALRAIPCAEGTSTMLLQRSAMRTVAAGIGEKA